MKACTAAARADRPFAGQRWFVGGSVFEEGRGGIARVARMTAKALSDGGAQLRIDAFLDETPTTIVDAASHPHGGSRARFVLACHRAALRSDSFVYDAVGPARAHPRVPGLAKPYIVWMHGVEVWDSLSTDRQRALRGASIVLVNSRFTLDRFEHLHGPLPQARVCELATEEDLAPAHAPSVDGPPTILVVGRLDRDNFRKGHREVIESFAQVRKTVPGARLVIAGDGDGMGLLKEAVAASGEGDAIEVLGFVPEREMPALWTRADVFALPSRKEGFGLVYAEAMRHGVPVVASVHDAGSEVNADGVTGFNVDLDRPGMLAERLIELLSNPGKARAMGQAGFARWHALYRYGAFRDRLWAILKEEAK